MKRTFALLLVILLLLLAAAAQAGELRVDFYDMGKADAMLITTPDGVRIRSTAAPTRAARRLPSASGKRASTKLTR